MFSIGSLSKRTGVKVPTIRYYEQMGLLAEAERSRGNQRRYDKDGLNRLSFIRHSRQLGFSLADIKGLLMLSQHPDTPCADAHDIAARHLDDVRVKIAKLRKLERELKRISACNAAHIADCKVIESLADHGLCEAEH
tara:strand:- start:583 stop:993 length:411 start_codon:yes stop_codon:yes gene_type:complete